MTAATFTGGDIEKSAPSGRGQAGARPLVVLRLFAAAREAAGSGRVEFTGTTVGEVLDSALERFGSRFAEVASTSKVWLNGDPASAEDPVHEGDEVALLPPVSGGSGPAGAGVC